MFVYDTMIEIRITDACKKDMVVCWLIQINLISEKIICTLGKYR